MAPFFSPDPGVSLQPSVVYSTSNSLVIAYVVILPLENILWLQVMNFYCLGSEVKALELWVTAVPCNSAVVLLVEASRFTCGTTLILLF